LGLAYAADDRLDLAIQHLEKPASVTDSLAYFPANLYIGDVSRRRGLHEEALKHMLIALNQIESIDQFANRLIDLDEARKIVQRAWDEWAESKSFEQYRFAVDLSEKMSPLFPEDYSSRLTARVSRKRRSPSANSISVRPVSRNNSASFLICSSSISKLAMSFPTFTSKPIGTRRTDTVLLCPLRENGCERIEGEQIALHTEPANHPAGGLRYVGVMSKRLAPEDVRQMHLDHRPFADQQRIKQRNRGVGIGTGVDDQPVLRRPRLLNPRDQVTLLVGLPEIQAQPQRLGAVPTQPFDITQGQGSINGRFPHAQHIQVGAVENQDRGTRWHELVSGKMDR